MKISTAIGGYLALIIIVSGLFIFLAESVTTYHPTGLPTDYNSSFVKITDQLTSIENSLNETNSVLKVETPTDTNSFSDYISFFFKAGYQSVVIAVKSVGLNNDIISMGIDSTIGESSNANIVKTALIAMVLLSVLVFIMGIIFKWEV